MKLKTKVLAVCFVAGLAVLAVFGVKKWVVRAPPELPPSGTMRNLAMLRSAISAYHDDNGRYPERVGDLIPKYLVEIPPVMDGPHRFSNQINLLDDLVPFDIGGWFYVNNPASKHFGEIHIDCSHFDGKKRRSEY